MPVVDGKANAFLYRHIGSGYAGLGVLEDQMCSFTGEAGEASPDRVDALVWGLTELLLSASGSSIEPEAGLPHTAHG